MNRLTLSHLQLPVTSLWLLLMCAGLSCDSGAQKQSGEGPSLPALPQLHERSNR